MIGTTDRRVVPVPTEPIIRAANDSEMAGIAAIYAVHVREGLASFEYAPPDAAEMARRRHEVLAAGLPYFVALRGGQVVGFAYAAPYRARPGYRHTVEDSVYVAVDCLRQGIGHALLARLIDAATAAHRRQMVAIIGDSDNLASINLHARCGFHHVGVLRSVGFKFGRWIDSVLMQRPLGGGDAAAPPP